MDEDTRKDVNDSLQFQPEERALDTVTGTCGNKGTKPDSHLVPKNNSAQASDATEGTI